MGRIFGQGFNIGFQIRQAFANFLQCITFNSTTSEFEDTKGNMNPVLNQVPVFIFEGGDKIILDGSFSGLQSVSIKGYFSASVLNSYGYILSYESQGSTSAEYSGFYIRKTNTNTIHVVVATSASTFKSIYSSNTISQDVVYNFELTINDNIVLKLNGSEWINQAFNDDIYYSAETYKETILGSGKNTTSYVFPFSGNVFCININGTELPLQHFSGNKVYSTDGSITGTISGTGSWWTVEDDIPDYNQQGCKIVEHAGGTAYVPLAISDATINSDYTSVTSITEATQDGTTLINDGALLDLHPTVSELNILDATELVLNGKFDTNLTGWANTSAGISEWDYGRAKAGANFGGIAGGIIKELTLEVGKKYRVVGKKQNINSSLGVSINILDNALSTYIHRDSDYTGLTEISVSYTFIATETNSIVYLRAGKSISGDPPEYGYFDNISVVEEVTLSDYFTEIETASGIDLNAVQGGDPLPIAYSGVTYEAGVKTNFGCLIPYNRYVSGDELTYAMDDTLTYYGIDEDKDFAIE